MAKLSAVVCAHNEGARLDACLAKLAFADELVVLLDRCTDGSEAIARRHGAVTVVGVFPLEGTRRAAALGACTGDWILEIDADELVDPPLADEIRAAIATSAADWFQLPVDNYVGAHRVRHGWGGSFGTSAVGRLYRAGYKSWQTQRVHPTAEIAGRYGGRLSQPLRHLVDTDISDMIRRLDRYTALRAQDLVDRGEVGGVASNVFRAFRRFFKCYVNRKGYREGGWGVLIALMAALFPLLSVLRAKLELMSSAVDLPAEQTPATDVRTPLAA